MSYKGSHISKNLALSFLVVMILPLSALAQAQTQYDKGTPPQHTAGVSSLGSYVSADLGTINLSNGALNFKIPIGSVGGRGFWVPLTLNYSSKVWSATTETDNDLQENEVPVVYADYDRGGDWVDYFDQIGAGWTVGAAPMLTNRIVRIQKWTSGPCTGGYAYNLAKLTLKLPDQGEVEFRDDYYDGAPLSTASCGSVWLSRGVRWHATDGSGMIFVNDVDNGVGSYPVSNLSGTVITADGTRYRFNAGGRCSSITDRNGNQITIDYVGSNEVDYTDQLGRVTSIKQNVVDPRNSSVTLALLVTLPGYPDYQDQVSYYKIKKGVMNQHYRSGINPTLPVINGDWDPLSYGYGWPGSTKLFFKSYGLYAQQIDNLDVLSELLLPDNRSLAFAYNQYGEVAEVQLPTGGKIQYDYAYKSALPSGNSPVWQTGTGGTAGFGRGGGITTDVKQVDRSVSQRRTYPDGVNLEGTWSYDYGPQLVNGTNYACSEVRGYAGTTSGTLMLDQRHFFLSKGSYTEAYTPAGNHDGTHYTLWSTGVEWRTETRDAAGAVLAASEQDWTQRSTVTWGGYPQEQPANDNRVNQTRRYLDTGAMAKAETFYDIVNYPRANNVSEVKEYDYDQSLKRRTTTTYVTNNNGYNYQTDDAIHLLRLPLTQTVYDGVGTQMAQTVSEYDVYAIDGNRALLTDYYPVSQHDSSYGAAKITRGNVTQAAQWLNTTGSSIYAYPRYDVLGNVVSAKDANGNVATISYADDFGDGSDPGSHANNPAIPTYALPTLITSPPPLPGAPVQTARSQYDYSTGLLTGFKDRNDVKTQTLYKDPATQLADPFNRPRLIISALGVSLVEAHTTMYYAQSTPTTVFGVTLTKNDVLTATDQVALDDAMLRSWTHTDGFGRTLESWTRDPQGDDKVATIYDGLGRAYKQSNPFRPSLGETAIYTTTAFDLAGRATSMTTPDNSVVTTSYLGSTVTVTDQAGKARKSVTDALGRLTQVYESPSGWNYLTTYTYDALDDLKTVTQDTQPQRSFLYDSLKRLTSASNPESGTITYLYDNNGNLTRKTDARGIYIDYVYDALNRIRTVDYSDTTTINPDISRFYDGATNGKGRFWYFYSGGDYSTGSNVDHRAIDSYDALGKPLTQRQIFKANGLWSPTYPMQQTYDLAGHVKTQTYPSIRTVNYKYDVAGRLNDNGSPALTGNLGDGATRTFASALSYDAASRMQEEKYGTTTPLYHKLHYNIRGQLYDNRLSTVPWATDQWNWNRGALLNFYDSTSGFARQNPNSGTDNNGNLLRSEIWIPNDDQMSSYSWMQQNYAYDALNRLTSETELQNGSSTSFMQAYNYDRWGNRTINAGSWGTGINTVQTVADPNTNRMYAPNDSSHTLIDYDFAGNQTKDYLTWNGTRTYDAENRMVTANNGVLDRYTYDADGKRTRRKVGILETWQVYGIGGEIVAEYAPNAPATTPDKEYGYRNGQLLVTAAPVDVALGKTATQSSTFVNVGVTFSANLAIDGNTNGTFWDLSSATTNYGYQNWWQVDIGSSQSLSSIQVWPRTDCCPEHTANFYVLVSDNAFTSTDLTTTLNQAGVSSYWVPGNNATVATVAVNRTGRYVRVQRNDSQYLVLAEVKVWQTTADVEWLVTDHLGTPRMIADASGSLAGIKRHDYLPFGEELYSQTGGRTTGQGYTAAGANPIDGARQKFTSKERDNETDLDYFGARYYGSTQGRFISVDSEGPTVANPQTFNRYRYALNNPLRYVDPDGRQEKEAWYKPILDYLRNAFGGTSKMGYPEAPPERDYSPMGLDARKLTEQHFKALVTTSRTMSNVISTLDPTGGAAVVQSFMEGNTKGAVLAGVLALPNLFGVSKAALTSGELLIGSVGKAEVAAQFTKSGETLTADVVGVFGSKESGLGSTTKQLLSSIMGFAKEEGLKEVKIQAVAVVNKDLERRLVKQGWQVTSVKVGDETVSAFTKTFAVK